MIAAGVLVLVVGFVLAEAAPLWRHVAVARLWTDPGWHPLADSYNVTPMLVATVLVASGATLTAAPLGILTAVFRQFYAPRPAAGLFCRLLELMAGIPSVVYGLWGLVVLVPWIARWRPPGASLLAGTLILAVMILPTVALLSDAALAAVPRGCLQAAAALGLSRFRTVWSVALPAARSGLTAAVLLAIARALGETMAVLMVCGNVVRLPATVFDPVRTLTANIALEMAYAVGDHRAALFACGAVLMALVGGLVVAVELLGRGMRYG